MSRVWITADLHLRHKNIHKYRNMASPEEHDAFVMDNLRSTVGKNDTVIFVGDIAFTVEGLCLIKFLDVKNKILIAGNHCTERVHFSHFVDTYNHVHALWKKKDAWISHAPLHPDHLRGNYCIHGHIHDAEVNDPRYKCVSLERTNYKPVLLEDVLSEIRSKCFESNEYQF